MYDFHTRVYRRYTKQTCLKDIERVTKMFKKKFTYYLLVFAYTSSVKWYMSRLKRYLGLFVFRWYEDLCESRESTKFYLLICLLTLSTFSFLPEMPKFTINYTSYFTNDITIQLLCTYIIRRRASHSLDSSLAFSSPWKSRPGCRRPGRSGLCGSASTVH